MVESIFSPENILPQKFVDTVSTILPRLFFAATMIEIAAVQQLSERKLLRKWLNENELSQCQSFKLTRRRNEWLAGRVCAKLSTAAIGRSSGRLLSPIEIGIANRADGRPYCILADGDTHPEFLDVSITHSSKFAAALAADSLCGIDIQQCREALVRVQDRYCSCSEERLLREEFSSSSRVSSLNLLWTAKEAVRKTLSYDDLPGFLQLKLCGIRHHGEGYSIFLFSYQNREIAAICTHFREYGIAVCFLEDKNNARTSRG